MAKKNKKTNTSPCELELQSLNYLGLSKQPFANEILTEKSFYNSPALIKITDSLTHQIQFSDLLLLVEGVHGSGKTSLFRQFIQSDITNIKSLSIQAEATDTLVQVQQKMSIHLQDLGDANHLDNNLKNLQMFDQTPLIIMDNAHVLSDTTLQELFRYQQQLKIDHEVNLKILLFANAGMRETLQKITDIQNDQMYVQNIPALSEKQISSFINHRLSSAGYTGEPIIDNNEMQQLLKKCDGTPLKIMTLAAPLIDKIIANKLKPSLAIWVKGLIAFIILLVLVAGAYAAYSFFIDDGTKIEQPVEDRLPLEPENNNTVEVIENNTEQYEPVTEPVEADINNEETISDVIEAPENNEPAIETDMSSEESAITTEPVITEANNFEKTEPVKKPVEATTAQVMAQEPEPAKNIVKTPEPEPEKITVVEKPKTIIKSEPLISPTLQQLNRLGLHDANWLRQQNSQNWTLQLLGARDEKTLLKFVQRNNLSKNVAWYKTWLTSKPYYVLVYGSYADRDTARNSVANLPPKVRSLRPWVKSMKSVQQAIQ